MRIAVVGAHRHRHLQRFATAVVAESDHRDLAAVRFLQADRLFERVGVIAVHHRRHAKGRDDAFAVGIELYMCGRNVRVRDLFDCNDDVHCCSLLL